MASAFTWEDGDRLIRFGRGALREAAGLLEERGFGGYALLTTRRAEEAAPALAAAAGVVLHVPGGEVPDAAAAVRDRVCGRPLVALGGGRVIDSAKAIAGADRLSVAALATTLSGAELTGFHRGPAGEDDYGLARPSLVIADPALMASQPMPQLAASAMNALAHAVEALYAPGADAAVESAALHAIAQIAEGLASPQPDRDRLALGALLAGWSVGAAGYAFIHVVCQTIVRVAGAPHAQTYAVVLPHGLRLLETRVPELLAKVAAALGAEDAAPGLAAARASQLGSQARVRGLSALGVKEAHVARIAVQAAGRAETANTPDPPSVQELEQLVTTALHGPRFTG